MRKGILSIQTAHFYGQNLIPVAGETGGCEVESQDVLYYQRVKEASIPENARTLFLGPVSMKVSPAIPHRRKWTP